MQDNQLNSPRVQPVAPTPGKNTRTTPAATGGGRLNLILHGLFLSIIDDAQDYIDVLVPDISPDHVYRAGNWLGETTLAGGTYELLGVDGGTAVPLVAQNLKFDGVKRSRKQPYATIRVKKPLSVQSLRRAKLDARVCFGGNTAVSAESQAWSGVVVFTYTYGNDADVVLDSHPWQPLVHQEAGASGNCINLHLFAEPEIALDFSHMATEFGAVATLFENLTLDFTCTPPHVPALETGPLPPGLMAEETEDLCSRTQRLIRLGRLRRDGVSADHAWDGTEGFGREPGACGGAQA